MLPLAVNATNHGKRESWMLGLDDVTFNNSETVVKWTKDDALGSFLNALECRTHPHVSYLMSTCHSSFGVQLSHWLLLRLMLLQISTRLLLPPLLLLICRHPFAFLCQKLP